MYPTLTIEHLGDGSQDPCVSTRWLQQYNIHAFHVVPSGLHHLASNVRKAEIERFRRSGGRGGVDLFEDDPVIVMHFDWFATTLVKYLRFVQWAKIQNGFGGYYPFRNVPDRATLDAIQDECRTFAMAAAPAVFQWRNKIGAHFSAVEPHRHDNVATRQASLTIQVALNGHHFFAGQWKFGVGGHDSQMQPWALTLEFERLAPRFWPSLELPAIPLSES